MIVRADLDASQGAAIRREAKEAGVSPDELARLIIAKHIYAAVVEEMNPAPVRPIVFEDFPSGSAF